MELVKGKIGRTKLEVYYQGRLNRIVWRCNRCGLDASEASYNFCPWCGAFFVGEVEEVRMDV